MLVKTNKESKAKKFLEFEVVILLTRLTYFMSGGEEVHVYITI